MQPSDILKKYWGFDTFRYPQDLVIDEVLAGRDTLALLPTGGGKSVCYQVPALAMEGVCIVISPLIALMKDQAQGLTDKGIKAVTLHSGLHYAQMDGILDNAVQGYYKFLFCSPERVQTDLFLSRFQQMQVSLIAVDEAHCISQWGYDFRPVYLKVSELRKYHPKAPVLALTATATDEVVTDIMEKLAFRKPNVLRKSFVRPNLVYAVAYHEDKLRFITDILQRTRGSSIIYTRNRRRTMEIAEYLERKGISASYYHAGLDQETRNRRQDNWMKNRFRVMVATNAFGMGIDKPDVRWVLHADTPDTPEAYFQEAGRAGRDGNTAFAILPYSRYDTRQLRDFFEQGYPPAEEVKRVYAALGNYLGIAVGGGAGAEFRLDMNVLSGNYNLPLNLVYRSLKILEKEGYLLFDESSYAPPRLYFTASSEDVYAFGVQKPAYRSLIQALLRSYPGLFNEPVKISLFAMAQRTGKSKDDVEKQLLQLQKTGLLRYEPESELPALVFLKERFSQDNFTLSRAIYGSLKEKARARMEAMIAYAERTDKCRSRLLTEYFGENDTSDCGMCDICKKKDRLEFSLQECEVMYGRARDVFDGEPLSAAGLLERIGYPLSKKNLHLVRNCVEKGFFVLDNDLITQITERK
ncbi:MAG: RecQ family ATP-dependent DNA helicase [Flavobacteriales bacterium]